MISLSHWGMFEEPYLSLLEILASRQADMRAYSMARSPEKTLRELALQKCGQPKFSGIAMFCP